MLEKTLVLIKPDGFKRKLVAEIIGRFERRGFEFVALKQLTMNSELADTHYAEHVNKSFYPVLKAFITSGPIVAFVLAGDEAVSVVRKMVGVTNSLEAEPGTIRGDLSLSKGENVIHASDSVKSAEREISLYFPELA